MEFPWEYGVFTLAVFVAGFGLVALGRFVRDRRTVRAEVRESITS